MNYTILSELNGYYKIYLFILLDEPKVIIDIKIESSLKELSEVKPRKFVILLNNFLSSWMLVVTKFKIPFYNREAL